MANVFSNTNNNIVKQYFQDNFFDYKVISEATHGPYWSVKYSNGEIDINISGDIGFGIDIFIGKTRFGLWQFDRSVVNKSETTRENILYQLNILKRFLIDSNEAKI